MDFKNFGNNALHNKFILYLLLLITATNLLFSDFIPICVLILFGLLSSLITSNKIIILSIALISMWLYKFNVQKVDYVEGMDNQPDINSYSNLLKIQKEILSNISTLEQSLENAEKIVKNITQIADS
jgi:hypothetical protein